MPIQLDDFRKVELRVARVLAVEPHPKADRLLILKLELGGEQRQVVSGIRESYPDPQVLVGRSLVLVANLEPALIRGVESQGMILATKDGSGISVLVPDREVAPGSKVS